ncbi:MAG: glycolate oxidase iron-sulfur subunit [Pseudohongiellaceae bacterium]|jgi:glycolate oxidase iron-sulfur subunit
MSHELAQCVHCGFCLPACPTYRVLGNEADSPRGRLILMDALKSGRITPTAPVLSHLDNCLLCKACETACPSGVSYGAQLQATRNEYRNSSQRPLGERLLERLALFAVALPPWVHDAGAALARAVHKTSFVGGLAKGSGRVSGAARLLRNADWTSVALPRSTPPSQRDSGGKAPRVALLEGCVGRVLFGRVNEATVRLLSRVGCEVVVPDGQRCCGALHAHSGDLEGARRLARTNIAAFEAAGNVDAIAVNAAGCGSTLAEYGELLANDPAWAERAMKFAASVKDALELLDEHGLQVPESTDAMIGPGGMGGSEGSHAAHNERRTSSQRTAPPTAAHSRCTVAYHDACHLAHARGIREPPRRLLSAIPGIELVELQESDRCCGSAGIYNLLRPQTAEALLDEKLARLEASGADVATAANPGCLLHLAAGIDARQSTLKLRHPLELLDAACRDAEVVAQPHTTDSPNASTAPMPGRAVSQ